MKKRYVKPEVVVIEDEDLMQIIFDPSPDKDAKPMSRVRHRKKKKVDHSLQPLDDDFDDFDDDNPWDFLPRYNPWDD